MPQFTKVHGDGSGYGGPCKGVDGKAVTKECNKCINQKLDQKVYFAACEKFGEAMGEAFLNNEYDTKEMQIEGKKIVNTSAAAFKKCGATDEEAQKAGAELKNRCQKAGERKAVALGFRVDQLRKTGKNQSFRGKGGGPCKGVNGKAVTPECEKCADQKVDQKAYLAACEKFGEAIGEAICNDCDTKQIEVEGKKVANLAAAAYKKCGATDKEAQKAGEEIKNQCQKAGEQEARDMFGRIGRNLGKMDQNLKKMNQNH